MAQVISLQRPSLSGWAVTKYTIGVCAYNEQGNIARLLDNLLRLQELDKNAEVLVVCSGCTDSTLEIVRQISKRDKRVELIEQLKRRGKAAAINEILKRSSNEIIFFIPADVLPAPLSLASMLSEFSNPEVGVVCGSPVPVNDQKSFSGYLGNLIWRMHNRTLKLLSESKINTHASGELMAIRRQIIHDLPLDIVNDDAYMAVQAASQGYVVTYCESAKVFMKAPTNVVDYMRQRRRIIFGHHVVKRLTKHYPRTLETMVFYDIRKVAKIVGIEVSSCPSQLWKFPLALCVEAFTNALALIDLVRKREHTEWKVAESTKSLDTFGASN